MEDNRQKLMISICMITYNHEKFIRQALDGILMQRHSYPYEIVVGEDFSTDYTREILLEYAKKYPKIFKLLLHEKNIGVMPNVVLTLKACSGKYIAMCEGDDYWTDPYKLQKQVDFLEANPDYVVCYHDAKIVDSVGNLIAESKLPDSCKRDYSAEELKFGQFLLTLSLCFRNVIKDFPEEMNRVLNGDAFLISLLGQYGKGKYLGSEIEPAIYRRHGGGIWAPLNGEEKRINSFVTSLFIFLYYRRINKKFAQKYLFKVVYQHFKNLDTENNPVFQEKYYRIGLAVTWLPRKVKNILQHLLSLFQRKR